MEADDMEMEGAPRPRARSESGGSDDDDDEGLCGSEVAGSWDQADLFDRIMHECRFNAPGQCFSAKLREEIERLSPEARRALVSRQRHGAAPLYRACARGNMAVGAYLVQVCGADLEQRGLYRAVGSRAPHRVTPLWAAAVAGRLDVLRALADAGARVDAGSDSGSTPLRSACFMSHVGVARFLLSRGADPQAANHHGGTCLVNSVQSAELCRLLLEAGAAVDAADSQRKTALHYAVQEHREDTARLLLAAGADPLLTTADGDDALQIACIKGATRLVLTLLSGHAYGSARSADAYELLGATQLDEYNDAGAARASWRVATAIRQSADRGRAVPKRPVRPTAAALGGVREWRSQTELDAHGHDADWLRAQALLVVYRVLGPTHKDTLFRLTYRGAAYADAFRYSRCTALWTWVLDLRMRKDTLLHTETCQTLLALTRLLLAAPAGERTQEERTQGERTQAARGAARLLHALHESHALPECQRLLSVRPRCRVQAGMFDRALRCAVHLAYVALCRPGPGPELGPGPEPGPEPGPGPDPGPGPGPAVEDDIDSDFETYYRRQVAALVELRLRTCSTGDSLLHLVCSRLNVVRSTYFADNHIQPSVFPHAGVARLLLASGARVSARNRARCTPLHLAAIPHNFSTELVETLLEWGAHLDQPNRFGESPAELVQLNPASGVRPLQHVTLACRCARALLRHPAVSARNSLPGLPATLRPFLELHQAES